MTEIRAERGRAIRVLLVLATSTGGIGTHVASLIRGLSRTGVDALVAAPQATEDVFCFAALGAQYFPVEISTSPRPASDVRAIRQLRALMSDVDIVHAHGLRAGFAAGTAVRLARGRTGKRPALITTLHNAILSGGPAAFAVAGLERTVVRLSDVILGASYDLVERARDLGAGDARLGQVAAPGLPPARRSPSEVRAEIGAEQRPLVLAIGRLAPQKAYGLLLDASLAWSGRTPPPLVVIAGGGPLRDHLQARIEAENLPVRLIGHRDDVSDLLAAADLVVLTSQWEARALAAQEALRAGKPLVATAVGGVPDLVGDAAVLVPYGEAGALAQAVCDLLDDPARAAQLSTAGLEQAAGWPSEQDTIDALRALYDEVTGRVDVG